MRKNGFTLIELMIIIVILGILAGVAIPKMFNMADRAKYCERARSAVAKQECAEYARKISHDKLQALVSDGKTWRPGETLELVEPHTNTVVQTEVKSSNPATGYTIVNDNIVVFHSTDNAQIAKDIAVYMSSTGKRNIGKVVKEGPSGTIMSFDY